MVGFLSLFFEDRVVVDSLVMVVEDEDVLFVFVDFGGDVVDVDEEVFVRRGDEGFGNRDGNFGGVGKRFGGLGREFII